MASFITTMFVPLQSSPPTQALPPHCTLKQSASCVTINSYATLEPPEAADASPSPAARKLREDLSVDCSSPPSNARSRNQFKPTRTNKGTTSYQLRQFAEATLGSGSLRKAVKLPEGEDLNEWLAVNGMLPPEGLDGRAQTYSRHSRRLLQPDPPPLWLNHRVLLASIMP
jgi:MOB kinase activator 1